MAARAARVPMIARDGPQDFDRAGTSVSEEPAVASFSIDLLLIDYMIVERSSRFNGYGISRLIM